MPKKIEIRIDRSYATSEGIMGYLFVNDQAICYTLELPWEDNENNVSAIPAGDYAAFLRYDKSDHWRLQLQNVFERTGVQIHVGNTTQDTEGCILVGMEANTDTMSIAKSKDAYKKLKAAFYGSDNPTATPDATIEVIVNDIGLIN